MYTFDFTLQGLSFKYIFSIIIACIVSFDK